MARGIRTLWIVCFALALLLPSAPAQAGGPDPLPSDAGTAGADDEQSLSMRILEEEAA